MDNHPIPQDVTGFQFKLIGNMTVKQFAYLATGVVFAWILWQLPVNILIKFPLCAFSAIVGAGLAFLPISGRPMDLMIGNYIKALFRPTQFVYEKTGGKIYFPNKASIARSVRQYKNGLGVFPKDKLKAYLESLDVLPKNKVDKKESDFFMSVSSLATNNVSPLPATNLNTLQTNSQINPIIHSDPPKPLNNLPSTKTTPPLGQKTISPILSGLNKAIGMPSVPDSPNLITGIIKDSRGNPLPNILIEVKDKDNNPIRAFKTNEVGRFASATPLINGTYTIEFEDSKAQNRFEKMIINVTGQIILPIVATSIDAREELRKSLFSTSTRAN